MKKTFKNSLALLLVLAFLCSFIPLPELHAAGDYYLSDDEADIITFDDSDEWYILDMNDDRVLAKRKGWEAHRYYDYNGKIMLNETKLKGLSDGSIFSEGYAIFVEGIIDKEGNFLYRGPGNVNIRQTQDRFYKGIIPVKATPAKEFLGVGNIGLMNTKGEWVVQPGPYYFDYAGVFEGLIVARDNQVKEFRKGYLNTKGELVIPAIYAGCYPFSEGLAMAFVSEGTKDEYGNENKYGIIIDKRQNEVLRLPKRHYIRAFSHGLAAVGVEEEGVYFTTYGYMDMDGNMRIQPQYGFAGTFSEGLAAVGKLKERKMDFERHGAHAHWSFIDEEGKTVIELGENYYVDDITDLETRYGNFSPKGLFTNGLCLIYKKFNIQPDKKVNNYDWQPAVIDTKGREIRLDRLSFFKNQDVEQVYFKTLFDQGHALVNYRLKGDEDGTTRTVMLKLKNPNMFKPYKVYNINDYHYDVKSGYAKSVNSDGISEDEALNNNTGDQAQTAKFNKLKLNMDGKAVSGIESYLIAGNSYFKLRDLAALVAPSPKKFSVDWSSEKKLITVKTGAAYTVHGSELKGGDGVAKTATPSKAVLEVNGKTLGIKAYEINGNNYYKLRDLADVLNLGLNWNEETMTIELSSK